MSKIVKPKTYFIGHTSINRQQIEEYLIDTDQEEFLGVINEAYSKGLSDGEVLCSFYAKMCYAALTTKKNKNISRVRDIFNNLIGTIKSGHHSVIEHCFLNFVTTDCSRILTHELIRHRVGTSFSQTSGRYVRNDELFFVHDPILDPVVEEIEDTLKYIEKKYKIIEDKMGLDSMDDFPMKKKITSAMRRILPNGQANEIGFGLNLRSLRHTIELRTSEHAEWEIRYVFNQIFNLVKDAYPAIMYDARSRFVDGAYEITFENSEI